MMRLFAGLFCVTATISTAISPVFAEEQLNAKIERAAAKGIEFLKNRGQADDGSFSGQTGSAVTALCVSAILQNRPQAIADPVVVKSLAFLQQNVRADGGI